jgi:hypothetical protein
MNKFYFLILFLSLKSFSLPTFESYIITNEGLKINIKTNFFQIDNTEKTVFYKLSNSDVIKKIKLKDFDYILLGANKFKTFNLNNSGEAKGYFVLSESPSKTLIVTTKPNEDNESTQVNYIIYILDSNENIIDSLQFDNLKNKKSISTRGDIFSKIRFYFNDCEALISRITSYDNLALENQNMDILNFFNSPVYIECTK